MNSSNKLSSDRCSTLLGGYVKIVQLTDRLPGDDLRPVLFGLYGEVGGIMAIAKKIRREDTAYTGEQRTVVEEFGDVLWYFTALCRRIRVGLDALFTEVLGDRQLPLALVTPENPNSQLSQPASVSPQLYPYLLRLGEVTSGLLSLTASSGNERGLLVAFADSYLRRLMRRG